MTAKLFETALGIAEPWSVASAPRRRGLPKRAEECCRWSMS